MEIHGDVVVRRIRLGGDIVPERVALSGNINYSAGGTIIYTGDYTVTPKMVEQVLETKNKKLIDNITVKAIPILRAANPYGGDTILIG